MKRTLIGYLFCLQLLFCVCAVAQTLNENKNSDHGFRIECPAESTDSLIFYREYLTDDYGVTFAYEFDGTFRANRWVAWQMHNRNADKITWRYDTFIEDDSIPEAYRVGTDEYNESNMDCGHIMASMFRLCSREQNKQTFVVGANTHPQYKKHNGMLWRRIENHVANKLNYNSFRDTLYITAGATIYDPNTLGKTSDSLIIPKYWFMALCCLKDSVYKAAAFLTQHNNKRYSIINIENHMVTVDSLEALTGFDFFCNLPDSIEDKIEAEADPSEWKL